MRSFDSFVRVRFEPETPTSTTCAPTLRGIQQELEDGKQFSRHNTLKKTKRPKDKPPTVPGPLDADPDGYFYAKRRLKIAVLEHYRCVLDLYPKAFETLT